MLSPKSHDSSAPFRHKHLLDVDGLSREDVYQILNLAKTYVAKNRQTDKKHAILKGRTLINLFFENSTRTRTSFELAGKRLGADVINMSVANSSVKKGETLIDTAMTLNAMHPDFISMRHPESGAVELLARKVNCSVINAGDGWHAHPTQSLLDALTILEEKDRIEGLRIAICGDILHSRVARSNMKLLTLLGAEVRLIAPPTLMIADPKSFGVTAYHDMRKGLEGCDVIMTMRLKTEYMESSFVPSEREYFHFWGLDYEKMSYAKKDAIILDPGPIIRGLQIDSDLADDIERSLILDQVEMGVAVRQAVLELLASNA